MSQGPSQTLSPSGTQSTSQTGSKSQTLSQSATVSQSSTPSLSQSPTHTTSPTTTATPSQTQTASKSQAPSQSGSRSQSPSPSLTQSPTQATSKTSTLTPSISPSPSQSISASHTLSGSQSPSQTVSDSSTSTLTASPSSSLTSTQEGTASQTATQATSRTQTTSATITGSPTATQTRSPSMTPEPYTLHFIPAPPNQVTSSVANPVTISDSDAAYSLALAMSRCPSDAGGVLAGALQCSVSPAGPIARSHRNGSVGVELYHSLPSAVAIEVGPIQCDPTSIAPVTLGVTEAVGAYFGGGRGSGTLVCRLTSTSATASRGATLAMGSLGVSTSPALWPLWEDAIIVTDFGLMRSPRLGRSFNATAPLLQAGGDGDVAAAVRNLTAVVAAAQSVWSDTAFPSKDDASSAFSMTLTGSTVIVLRSLQPAFRRGSTATLGMGTCTVGAVSDDGMWLALVTPQSNTTCASARAGTDCGYVTLTVNTSLAAAPLGSSESLVTARVITVTAAARGLDMSVSDVASEITSRLGVALPCPPFCPGAISGGERETVPALLPDGTFGLAVNPASVGSAIPPSVLTSETAPLLSSASSAGIFYALACAQSGICPSSCYFLPYPLRLCDFCVCRRIYRSHNRRVL